MTQPSIERADRDLAQGVGVVLVRNAVDHDSRVLREARLLTALGLDTTVLGVVSFTQTQQVTEQDGAVVRRIGPSSRIGWAVYREISRLSPERAEAPAPAASGAPARSAAVRRALGRLLGVRALCGPARRSLRWLSTLAYYARTIAAVRELRPDLVHCNDYNTMWIGLVARVLWRSAVVYDSHELWADRNLRGEPRAWLVACEALFTRVADRVVTTSPAYAEELARRYRIELPVVVRNIPERAWEGSGAARATEAGERAPDGAIESPRGDVVADRALDGSMGSRREDVAASERPNGRTAVYVGGLQPGRGIEQSIRALLLAEDVKLRLLGPGAPSYRAELERLVASLGLERRVELRDPVAPADLLPAIGDADAGLALIEPACLSYRLTLPNKLFEYALAGLPVIGSDLPMIARFVSEHGLGTTVDPEDVEAIAAALDDVLDPDRNERYRAAARRSAATLDWEIERQLLAAVYREALAARSRRVERR